VEQDEEDQTEPDQHIDCRDDCGQHLIPPRRGNTEHDIPAKMRFAV
jgi:hypothetical protein